MDTTRTEKDSLGTKKVPDAAYYGIQTLRAVENFPISGLRAHPKFIESDVMVKKAAAIVNMEVDLLKPGIAKGIIKAADEILDGKLRDQFIQISNGTTYVPATSIMDKQNHCIFVGVAAELVKSTVMIDQ